MLKELFCSFITSQHAYEIFSFNFIMYLFVWASLFTKVVYLESTKIPSTAGEKENPYYCQCCWNQIDEKLFSRVKLKKDCTKLFDNFFFLNHQV